MDARVDSDGFLLGLDPNDADAPGDARPGGAAQGDEGDGSPSPPASPLLRKYPSFVPLARRATSIAEVAFLVPSAGCATRRASVSDATFNMTATIVGGGVLSIPLACARAGIVPFTLLMALSALATDLSLYLLVSCARRCGSTSFGRVARSSFGPGLELASTVVIFFLVGFIVVGLMILNMGIWAPIAVVGAASLKGEAGAGEPTSLQDAAVLLALMGLMMGFLLKRDLTSLSHICYVGFFSIAILCVAMIYRTFQKNLTHPDLFHANVKWWASETSDVLSALPIILLAFLCSFNIIGVQCSLVNPTRRRAKGVIHQAVFLSFLLMYVFGLAGYLFAYDATDGNVLLNFDPKDPAIFLGRIGCGVTTLFALPMNVLPCREALLSLAAQVSEMRARKSSTREERRRLVERRSERDPEEATSPGQETGEDEEDGTSRRPSSEGGRVARDAKRPLPRKSVAAATACEDRIHLWATVGIVGTCFAAAVLAPGVAVVWDIAGSSMAFLIQFIVPAACYVKLKLRARGGGRGSSRHLVLAWALLAFAVVMAVVCTTQTVGRLVGSSR